MGKVLIVYFSETGTVEQMANYIAEGVRIAGHEADLRRVSLMNTQIDLAGYDGYIFGCPVYHLDLPEPFKNFLTTAAMRELEGKAGGAFSSRAHPSSGSEGTASKLFQIMESRFRMRMTKLGPFDLDPGIFESMQELMGRAETIRTCQDYGKALGEMLRS